MRGLYFTFTFMHLADAFIQSDLQCIQAIHFLSVHVFPGNRTHNLCAANAMLYHWATGTFSGEIGQFKILSESRKYFSIEKLHTYYITFNAPEREEIVRKQQRKQEVFQGLCVNDSKKTTLKDHDHHLHWIHSDDHKWFLQFDLKRPDVFKTV